MNRIVAVFLLIILLGGFSTQVFAKKTWQEYVSVDISGRQHGYGYGKEQEQLFKQQLTTWEKNKESDEKTYEDIGFTKSLAAHFVKERIRWAKGLIDSRFNDEVEIPQLIQFVDNRAKLMTHISQLEHDRFKKLVEKYNFKVTNSFYNCLCRATGAGGVGGGVGYYNGKCEATGVLGGHWTVPFPKNTKRWSHCSKNHPLSDGGDIFRAISKNSNISREGDTSNERIIDIIKNRNQKFKKLCLPSLTDKLANNILKTDDLTRSAMLKKSLDISNSSENICEEAVAMDLFLNSQQGLDIGEFILEAMKPWILPDRYGLAEWMIGAPAILSSVNNIKSNIELLGEVYDDSNANLQFKETLKVFQSTKNWSTEKLNSYELEVENKISGINANIKTINRILERKLFYLAPEYPRPFVRSKNYNDKWNIYDREGTALINIANAKKRLLNRKRIGLLLKQSVIENYRIPLSNKTCEEFLKDRKNNCK